MTPVSGLLLLAMAGCSSVGSPYRGVVTVLEGSQTYEARLEPERIWTGVLGEAQRDGEPTPDKRLGLYYLLTTDSGAHLMYTKDIIPRLETLLGRRVSVRGKLLTPPDDEVPSEELWPATVQLDETVQTRVPRR